MSPAMAPMSARPADGVTRHNKTGADGSTTQGTGIYLNNTKDVQLNGLQMNDFQNYAILGTGVNGFTLDHTTINGTNGNNVGGIGEGDVYFTGLSGSASVSNSTFTGAAYDAFHVFNDSAQTLNRLTITGSTFATNSAAGNASGDGIRVPGDRRRVQRNGAKKSERDFGPQRYAAAQSPGTVSSDLVLTGNTFNNSNQNIVSGGGGLTIGGGGPANNITLTYDISNNTIKGALGAALAVFKGHRHERVFRRYDQRQHDRHAGRCRQRLEPRRRHRGVSGRCGQLEHNHHQQSRLRHGRGTQTLNHNGARR